MTAAVPSREGGKTTNPYVGPRPFDQADTYRFFGRDREAAELYSLVAAHRTVLLYAQSGAGKTSLLNAGLIPLLQQGGFDVLPTARVSGLGEQALRGYRVENIHVLNCIAEWAEDTVTANVTLLDVLTNRPRRAGVDGEPPARVAIFDQFEELFTAYPERWRDRRGFFEQLDAAMSADPSLRVLFAMREDFVAHIDPYEDLLPEEFRTRYRLEQLREDAALTAVERPLEGTGVRFESGVAERLVRDLLRTPVSSMERVEGDEDSAPFEEKPSLGYILGEFVEPVQLQVVCFNLFRSLPQGTTEITQEHLAAFGDVDQALREFYQSALKEAAEKAKISEDSLRQWFETKLITEAGTRGLVFRGETTTGGIPNAAVDALEELHIIRPEVRGTDRWYELSHDRFLQPILRANDAWRARVQEGERRRQEEESRRLVEAERAEAEKARQQAEGEARQAQRFRRLSLALGGVLLLALVAIGVALWQWRRARQNANEAKQNAETARRESARAESEKANALTEAANRKVSQLAAEEAQKNAEADRTLAQHSEAVARARELVSSSLLNQDADPQMSVLIAAQAVAVTWPWGHTVLPEAEQQLHRAILTSHLRMTLGGHSNPVWSVAWSPDGKRLATGSNDETAKVWDAETGKELATLKGHDGGISSVGWSPDGKRLATGSGDQKREGLGPRCGQGITDLEPSQ